MSLSTYKIPQKIKINNEIKEVDFSNFLFRCHYLKDLVGAFYNQSQKPPLTEKQFEEVKKLEAKEKLTEKQKEKLESYQLKVNQWAEKQNNIQLEPGSISILNKIWNEEVLGIRETLKAEQVKRGINQEDESIQMLSNFYNKDFKKNTERLKSDYLTGEPDLIINESIIDIKTCKDWSTFDYKTLNKASEDYFWQLWAYKVLTNKKKCFIAYVLPSYSENVIDKIILKEFNQIIDFENASYYYKSLKFEGLEKTLKKENQEIGKNLVKKLYGIYLQEFNNHNFDRIPKNKRLKICEVKGFEKIDTKIIYQYLDECRLYLQRKTERFNNFNPILEK